MSICGICGKRLRGSTPEAVAAHQRESQSCMPAPSGPNAPKALRDAEASLARVIAAGRALASTGSYEQIQQNERERSAAEAEVRRVRKEGKDEKHGTRDTGIKDPR